MTNTYGEMGIFPALLEPAREAAKEVTPGKTRELARYPGFWVCRIEDAPIDAIILTRFKLQCEEFVLFELH